MTQQLQQIIDNAWEDRANLSPKAAPKEVIDAVEEAIVGLNNGSLRVATREGVGQWTTHQWLKKAVLLSFRLNDNAPMHSGDLAFYDKVQPKFSKLDAAAMAQAGVRVVPPAVARRGIIAVDLDDNDFLIGAALTKGKHDVMLFSDGGKAVRFDENDVRCMGRNARGVRGMMLEEGQSVIAMLAAPTDVAPEDQASQPTSVLTATENGFGKRTPIEEYTRHGRGTKGMIAIQQSGRNGKVVAATLVHTDDEIMLITDTGVLVRTRVSEIREMGRATQGVTLIGLDEGSKLIGMQRIADRDAENVDAVDAVDAADDAEGPATPPSDAPSE